MTVIGQAIERCISLVDNPACTDCEDNDLAKAATAEVAAFRELYAAAKICDCANSQVETRLSRAVAAVERLGAG